MLVYLEIWLSKRPSVLFMYYLRKCNNNISVKRLFDFNCRMVMIFVHNKRISSSEYMQYSAWAFWILHHENIFKEMKYHYVKFIWIYMEHFWKNILDVKKILLVNVAHFYIYFEEGHFMFHFLLNENDIFLFPVYLHLVLWLPQHQYGLSVKMLNVMPLTAQ